MSKESTLIALVMNSQLLVKRRLHSTYMKTFKRFTIASKVTIIEFTCSDSNIFTFSFTHTKETTDPLERELAELAESIFDVKAKQEYIVFRERQHRDSK